MAATSKRALVVPGAKCIYASLACASDATTMCEETVALNRRVLLTLPQCVILWLSTGVCF